MVFLRFLLISIAVLWVIRIVVRLVLPMIFRSVVKNAAQRASGQQRKSPRPDKPEGQINVDFIPPKDKEAKAADKAGEFIDYEEIK